jgi:hypothetical protein
MKTYLTLFLIVTIFFAGCKKDKNEDGNPIGTWELRHINGIQIPGAPSDFKAGNGEIIQFTPTNMKIFSGGKLMSDRKYSIIKKETVVNKNKVSYQLLFDADPAIDTYFKISDGKLTIYLGIIAADGVESTYAKQ